MSALDLLSGDAQTFRSKVWASQVHVHHTDPADLIGLLGLDDVDHLLTSTALRTPALRVARDGEVLPASAFTRKATMAGAPLTGLVDGRKVLALFEAGATVVLQGLQRYWPPLTRLVRDLELELGHPCQANAYLTPPGSQGFARHSDSHDVFVFQTHGHKQWEVVDQDEERSVLLEPGVSMYLPTGTPHAARSQDATSLHVTLGINRLTWRDLLGRVTDSVLADERYDVPLPAGYLDEPEVLSGELAGALRDHADRVAGLDATAVVEQQTARFLSTRTPLLRGGLNDLVALAGLADDTLLERRSTARCVLGQEPGPPDGRLVVRLGDRELRMPRRLTGPMELVRDSHTIRPADLSPWLDVESRLVVTRRLVREGLLRIAETDPAE